MLVASMVDAFRGRHFKGQAVNLTGEVSPGMQYVVSIDGTNSTGTPSNGLLASISGLELGDHTVSITAMPLVPGAGSSLTFEGAVVTVGTGLTG
jgi:hypothetical protein